MDFTLKGGAMLANTNSAKKRIKVIARRQARNKSLRSSTKTTVKKFMVAVEGGDKSQALQAHKLAVKAIDQAAAKGIYHKNTASRKKSQLAKMMNG